MSGLRKDYLLLTLVVVSSVPLASGVEGFQSSGFFRGDLLMLSEKDVRQNYERKLVVVLGVLPAKRHCGFLRTVADHFSSSINGAAVAINRYSVGISGRTFMARRKCRQGLRGAQKAKALNRTTLSFNQTFDKTFIVKRLVRLYNKLPLPFQCQILEEVGWKSVVNSKNKFLSKSEAWSGDRTAEISRIVQQTEQVLGQQYALIRVGSQCARIMSGEDSHVATVKFSCHATISDSKAWLRLFKKQMARVYGKFAADNGIQIPKEVLLFVGSRDLPYNAYHIEVLNISSFGNFHQVMFHIHLKKANSKALPANFILSSLHRYSTSELENLFQARNISFTAMVDKVGRRPSRRYNNMRKLFPAYLSKYFSMLDPHEKCFILSMLSSYTNHTLSRIIQFLNRKRFQVQICCFPKKNDVSVKSNRENIPVSPQVTTPPSRYPEIYTTRLGPFEVGRNSKSEQVSEVRRIAAATPVEISMFVVLGAVVIVGTIFVLICITYFKRKRELKREKRQQARGMIVEERDRNSIDSAELDWIQRTRQIESEGGLYGEEGNFIAASGASGTLCIKCELQRTHSIPRECMFARISGDRLEFSEQLRDYPYRLSFDHHLPQDFSNSMSGHLESPGKPEGSGPPSESEHSNSFVDERGAIRCKTKDGTACVLRQARYAPVYTGQSGYAGDQGRILMSSKARVAYYRPHLPGNLEVQQVVASQNTQHHNSIRHSYQRNSLSSADSLADSSAGPSSGSRAVHVPPYGRTQCDGLSNTQWYPRQNLPSQCSDTIAESTCSDCGDFDYNYKEQQSSSDQINFPAQPPPSYSTCVGVEATSAMSTNPRNLHVIRGARRYRYALKSDTEGTNSSPATTVRYHRSRFPFIPYSDCGGTAV